MIELDDFYGFPARLDKEKGTVEIESNCFYPNQSNECKELLESIERLFIDEAKLKYPLNINHWKVIFEPTQENIKKHYSTDGIMIYLQEIKKRLIGNAIFLKPEVTFGKSAELPYFILHFYQVNYEEKLNIRNSFDFVDKCSILYKDMNQLTDDRIQNLIDNGVDIDWIRSIPLIPVEQIKFDNKGTILKFKFQELNKSSINDEK
jgi:hypothetical protein